MLGNHKHIQQRIPIRIYLTLLNNQWRADRRHQFSATFLQVGKTSVMGLLPANPLQMIAICYRVTDPSAFVIYERREGFLVPARSMIYAVLLKGSSNSNKCGFI